MFLRVSSGATDYISRQLLIGTDNYEILYINYSSALCISFLEHWSGQMLKSFEGPSHFIVKADGEALSSYVTNFDYRIPSFFDVYVFGMSFDSTPGTKKSDNNLFKSVLEQFNVVEST